jgi:hypothetical protein
MLVKSSFFELINVIIKKERMRFKTISFQPKTNKKVLKL